MRDTFKYRIYRNLHTETDYSIQCKRSGRWRVIDRRSKFTAKDCIFKVYEKGRQRTLIQKHKNVHAFLLCKEIEFNTSGNLDPLHRITYNPYTGSTFMHQGTPISESKSVYFSEIGVFMDFSNALKAT